MSVAIACYGHLGPQAESNPRVAELLQRSVDGQHRAHVAFTATLDSITARGLKPWFAPAGELTLLLNQWITLLAWERSTVFLDAALTVDPTLGDQIYRQVDQVCDEAAALSLHSIRMQTEMNNGSRPGNAKLAPLSLLQGNPASLPMVWANLEAVYTRVRADLALIAHLGVPSIMSSVNRALLEEYKPKAEQFDYLVSQWQVASTAENKLQCVRQAIPLAKALYEIGQQVWAPYLTGSLYIEIARNLPLFAQLGLPFDPWILTDPTETDKRARQRTNCVQLAEFWQTIADPLAAQALQAQINEALDAENIQVVPHTAFMIAPWQPRYQVVYPVSIGQQQLEAGDVFTLHPRSVDGKRTLEIRVTKRS